METEKVSSVSEARGEESLWMVVAVIQPFKLDAVTLALEEIPGFGGMTVSECRGFGREKVQESSPTREESTGLIDFTTKMRVECAVSGTDKAQAVMEAIARAAHTGNRGDGKLFAWPIARAVRLRTFEEAGKAL